MGGGKVSHLNFSLFTSASEGKSLGELEGIWQDLAASEARINMMDKLITYKVGFNDVENFNLGLIFNSKMVNIENEMEKNDKMVVEAAMKFKRRDEILNRKRLIREKLRIRKRIETETNTTINQKKRLLKHLKLMADVRKKEMEEKYEKKVRHLRNKYEVRRKEEMSMFPKEM